MTPRSVAAGLSGLVLAVGLMGGTPTSASAGTPGTPVPPAAHHTAVTGSATVAESRVAAGKCLRRSLTPKKAIRTRSGRKLGTARMFLAKREGHVGFCVRFTPIPRLRTRTTVAMLTHQTFYPTGSRSGSGKIGGSGLWRHPFLLTGSHYGTGFSMKAVARLRVPGGPAGKATLKGALP